jgi:hypothetical protein
MLHRGFTRGAGPWLRLHMSVDQIVAVATYRFVHQTFNYLRVVPAKAGPDIRAVTPVFDYLLPPRVSKSVFDD